jgi:hypothetical protein
MVQDAREKDLVVGPFTDELIRELGDSVRKGTPRITEGVRLRGARGEGYGLGVDVDTGDIVAVAGELEGDVTESGTDVEDPARLRSDGRLHQPGKLSVRKADEIRVPPETVAEVAPGSKPTQVGDEPFRVGAHSPSLPTVNSLVPAVDQRADTSGAADADGAL